MTTLEFFRAHQNTFLDQLHHLIDLETPTGDVPRAEQAAAYLQELVAPFGELSTSNLPGWGPLVHLRRPGTGASVALLAHYDTVWPVGSWPQRWIPRDGLILGPGTCDMKGGLLFVVWMLRALETLGLPHPDLEVLFTPDEEVGALGSRPLVEEAARRSDFVLVTECPGPRGELKLERKGSAEFTLHIEGKSTHQGESPEEGVNAVVEAAHQVLKLLQLERPELGTTVGPNLISGGTMSNVVAEHCKVTMDLRAWNADEVHRLNRALQQLEPRNPRARLHLSGSWNRPPMEATAASRELAARARQLGRRLGLELGSIRWGGSSDANLTAAVGTPTLDGLGPDGDGSHRRDEHLRLATLAQRLALLTDLITSLTTEPQSWLSPEAQSVVGKTQTLAVKGE